ncbi:MIP/aquaporin family protein [Poriferisphaera sp. WC338]|uniref:MIP/aquaporin family protein n=1 Tax=Poriferisphaera sp. WC338 TaxID=3425129 RepID=UPI003D81B22D
MNNLKACVAEALGTFALVLAGTGAIVFNDVSNGAITHLGIALTFGLIVMAMIAALGPISGAHINPAVSIAFVLGRKCCPFKCTCFIIAQLIGAFTASFLILVMYPDHPTLGSTLPAGPAIHSFILEMILTFFLMLVILQVALTPGTPPVLIPLAIGATVGLEALFAGPITGASMNPARSIAPAIASGNLQHLWLYIAAPIIGAALAVPTWLFLGSHKKTNAPSEAPAKQSIS